MDEIHYDESYFNWQSTIGKFGGWANLGKYERHIDKNDVVIDFGCGGGFLLNNIDCNKKIGIEINPYAAKNAKELGIEVYNKIEDISDEIADIIISNHALEHVHRPLDTLISLRKKLKKGGKIVFTVPCEGLSNPYKPGDINRHIYTWSPMNLGNLFDEAGFSVEKSVPYRHMWLPRGYLYGRYLGRPLFDFLCKIYDRLRPSQSQVKIIARKK